MTYDETIREWARRHVLDGWSQKPLPEGVTVTSVEFDMEQSMDTDGGYDYLAAVATLSDGEHRFIYVGQFGDLMRELAAIAEEATAKSP